MKETDFEDWLATMVNTPSCGMSQAHRDAIASVADTALTMNLWLRDNRPDATAADVLAMTRLVLEHEAELYQRRQEAE